MKRSIVQFAFVVVALVVGGALEDMLPHFGGVGVPVLLGAAVFFAVTVGAPAWVLAALAAGALEEALSAQPAATAIVFFAALALAARFLREPLVWALVAYPAYQVWLALVSDASGAFGRFLLSIPVGAFAVSLTFVVLSGLWRKAGADA